MAGASPALQREQVELQRKTNANKKGITFTEKKNNIGISLKGYFVWLDRL